MAADNLGKELFATETVEDRNLDGSRYLQRLVHISGDSLPEECSHGKTYFPAYSERFSWAAIIGLGYWFLAKLKPMPTDKTVSTVMNFNGAISIKLKTTSIRNCLCVKDSEAAIYSFLSTLIPEKHNK